MDINDLYFGVKYLDPHSRKMETINLFNIWGVKWGVATWVTSKDYQKTWEPDSIFFDVKSRCEWEWMIDSLGAKDMNQTSQKVDIYGMYVEPNFDYLMSLINQVSKTSARKWLVTNTERKRKITK